MAENQIALSSPGVLHRSVSVNPQMKRTLPPKQRSLSLEQLIEIGKLFLDETNCDRFVETKAFTEGKTILERHLCLGIIGPSCSGKETLARQIIKRAIRKENDERKRMRPVSISKPADWELVVNGFNKEVPKENYILIIEDIFGKAYYDKGLAADWEGRFKYIFKLSEKRNIHIVFTCNTIVFNGHLTPFFDKKYLLYLHDEKYKLSEEQRSKILGNRRRSVPIRFPWFCLGDIRREDMNSLYEFIRTSLDLLYKYEEDLYTVLLYILLNGGTITCEELDKHLFYRTIQRKLPMWAPPCVIEIKKCCDRLLGTYLIRERGIYSFYEPCIRHIVLLTAYMKCPEMIDVCPLRFAIERTNFGQDTDDNFKLQPQIICILVKRIKKRLANGEHFENCVPLVDGFRLEKVLQNLSELEQKKICEALFLSSCDHGDRKSLSLILGKLKDDMIVCIGDPVPLLRVIKSETDGFLKCCLLLDRKCPYENICTKNRHILHYITVHWSEDRAKELVNNYKFLAKLVNVGDGEGNTPVHLAASGRKTEGILSWLVSIGADVSSLNKSGQSPLQLALETMNKDSGAFVMELLRLGADNSNGRDLSLFHVRECRFLPLDVVVQLIGGPENINQQNEKGWTYLHHAVEINDLCMAKILLELGADVNIPEHTDHLTPLSLLCRNRRHGYDEMLKLLIENGSHVNHKKKFNETPLHEAVECGSVDTVRYLLQNKADPNAITQNNKKTPLHKVIDAPRDTRKELVGLLLKHGADECLRDFRNKTLRDLAEKKDRALYKHIQMRRQVEFDGGDTANRIENSG